MEGLFYERVHALECEFAEKFKPLFEKVRQYFVLFVIIYGVYMNILKLSVDSLLLQSLHLPGY